MSRRVRRLVPITLAIVAVLAVSQTALGFVETKTTGTVGVHSYTDSVSKPGITCTYQPTSTNDVQKLKRMYINPPKMKAVPGMGMEQVGFQYKVQRQITGFGGPGKWKVTYTSPVFKTHTNSHNYTSWGQDSVNVHVPYEYGADASATYRVIVKELWYEADDTTILGSVTGRLQHYVAFVGLDSIPHAGYCQDYED